jgi:hypothetical protein
MPRGRRPLVRAVRVRPRRRRARGCTSSAPSSSSEVASRTLASATPRAQRVVPGKGAAAHQRGAAPSSSKRTSAASMPSALVPEIRPRKSGSCVHAAVPRWRSTRAKAAVNRSPGGPIRLVSLRRSRAANRIAVSHRPALAGLSDAGDAVAAAAAQAFSIACRSALHALDAGRRGRLARNCASAAPPSGSGGGMVIDSGLPARR